MTKDLTEIISVRFPNAVVADLQRRYESVGIQPSEYIRRCVIAALASDDGHPYLHVPSGKVYSAEQVEFLAEETRSKVDDHA